MGRRILLNLGVNQVNGPRDESTALALSVCFMRARGGIQLFRGGFNWKFEICSASTFNSRTDSILNYMLAPCDVVYSLIRNS